MIFDLENLENSSRAHISPHNPPKNSTQITPSINMDIDSKKDTLARTSSQISPPKDGIPPNKRTPNQSSQLTYVIPDAKSPSSDSTSISSQESPQSSIGLMSLESSKSFEKEQDTDVDINQQSQTKTLPTIEEQEVTEKSTNQEEEQEYDNKWEIDETELDKALENQSPPKNYIKGNPDVLKEWEEAGAEINRDHIKYKKMEEVELKLYPLFNQESVNKDNINLINGKNEISSDTFIDQKGDTNDANRTENENLTNGSAT